MIYRHINTLAHWHIGKLRHFDKLSAGKLTSAGSAHRSASH